MWSKLDKIATKIFFLIFQQHCLMYSWYEGGRELNKTKNQHFKLLINKFGGRRRKIFRFFGFCAMYARQKVLGVVLRKHQKASLISNPVTIIFSCSLINIFIMNIFPSTTAHKSQEIWIFCFVFSVSIVVYFLAICFSHFVQDCEFFPLLFSENSYCKCGCRVVLCVI